MVAVEDGISLEDYQLAELLRRGCNGLDLGIKIRYGSIHKGIFKRSEPLKNGVF